MAKNILVIGSSGVGKTTSMKNLRPQNTYYIDCDLKGLNWKNWRENYNSVKKNFYQTNKVQDVIDIVKGISDTRPDIETIVIDTINNLMIAQELRASKIKGFDKWYDMTNYIYDLVDVCNSLRTNLTVFMLAHDEEVEGFLRVKTSGQKLSKLVLESKFNYVIQVIKENHEIFYLLARDNSTLKFPFEYTKDSNIIPACALTVKKLLEGY